ncbi:PLP-dependent aminotransferase family protein [Paenarthrobacter sp. NPDC090520]|uniref:aminotransferase-like domain-containing protein n=1 Tax=Paenarthrobacter sp. NPDC090520 TaxID=3364382 RepID=UPI0038120F71
MRSTDLLNNNTRMLGSSPIRDLLEKSFDPGIISFAGGNPAAEFFDVEGMSRSFQAVMDRYGRRAMQYSSTDGEPEMRAAAASRTAEMGVPTDPDQVLITTGSQQGIGLLGQTLINHGDVVLVENPTFVSALLAFSLQGARFKTIHSDENGAVPESLEEAIRRWKPKAVYLIPTFQNPTGSTLTQERRTRIADILAEANVWLIEDDPYSDIRFTNEKHIPISADPRLNTRSFLLNSLSKVLAPGIRIGWIRSPKDVLPYLSRVKQASTLQSSTIDQLAAAHYLQNNDLPSRLAPVKAEYMNRRDHLMKGLMAALPAGTDITRPKGGLFIWARLPAGFNASVMLESALLAGTMFIPGAPFYVEEADQRTMRFSYSSNPVGQAELGLTRLANAFAEPPLLVQ